ncbi:MAG: outer membrane lipoprotein-sorting protein [Candidatus Aminicenantes bacterium]|nr:MAG: outer membrane lipoprotein-sorting protein [Candidatus Aminicenantes bacterium]
MKKTISVFSLLVLMTATAMTQAPPSGEDILKRVDANIGSDNKIATAEMIIHGRRGSRSIKSKSWIYGIEKSYTEYLAPAREAGTKMLKLEEQLWTYIPSTDRTIKISGHMLRQSVMGSDLSYEDMMEDPELLNLYNANIIEESTFLERPCWILELTAKVEDISYHSRKIWVDKERYVSLKEERFARSGKLLKVFEVKEVRSIQNRWVPVHMVFKDALKSGKGTEYFIESIEFNADIPEALFTKASLR